MQLDDITVRHPMLAADLLSVESGIASYPRVSERARQVLVYQPQV